MTSKTAFLMYESWGAAIDKMSDEQAGQLIKAIYALQKNPDAEPQDPSVAFVFAIIKDKMSEDSNAYEETCRQRSEAGRKGSEARWGKMANDSTCHNEMANDSKSKQSIAKMADTDTESDTDTENESEKKNSTETNKVTAIKDSVGKKNTRGAHPTLAEVEAYCLERGNGVNAQRFIDYYESNGWKVGKNPMKDWKACVRNWERNGYDQGKRASPAFDSNDYLLGIIEGGGV